MTDVSSVQAHADPQPASGPHYAAAPPPTYLNGSPALDSTIEEEDSSTIKCICGYADDDGNTVLCEKCNTWQHILCYYESAGLVPDVHLCTDCLPRPVDRKGAVDRQRSRRELQPVNERKGRPRTTTKSHKKRPKDSLGAGPMNGWAVHSNNELQYNTERKSGSPRDQPPPAKRPKTSHRSSGSVVSQAPALAPNSRKRTGSVMLNGHSPVKSPTEPDGPVEEFSLEFMNLSYLPEPLPADINSYNNLEVTREITSWFNDRDALVEATGGISPGHAIQRIEQSIEDMEASHAPIITKQTDEDSRITVHNMHPRWHLLVVESPVADGGFIGELRGCIGRKQEYKDDPSNRWELLKHPEPFVFFPPHLPIYIDTREKGTILRYARRSCKPNMTMKILTQGTESGYHFCFLATRDIEPGEELTIGWDIDSEIRHHLEKAVTNGDIKKEGFKKIQPWVTTVLANFGGCACDSTAGYECLLERARRNATTYAEPLHPLKTTRGRKPKKAQVSPLSTGHATNSRAGSEAFLRDAHDEENIDSRSTSGSHKSSSRDITPATHLSVDDGTGKMSERERRKIQQQERLFEQLEYDEQHKGKRGKRNSAGSTLNTPGLSSSVRRSSLPSRFIANSNAQKQFGHAESSPSLRNPREHSNGVARKTSGTSNKTNGRAAQRPKPQYVDNSTQTDNDKPGAMSPMPQKVRAMRPPPISFKRKLLQQAQEDKLQRERTRSASVKMEAKSPPALQDVTSNKASPAAPSMPADEPTAMDMPMEPELEVNPRDPTPAKEPTPAPSAEENKDVEMKDAEETAIPRPPSPKVEDMPDALSVETSSGTSHSPIQPPPPPWPSTISTTQRAASPSVTKKTPEPTVDNPAEPPLEISEKPELTVSTPSSATVVSPGSVASVPSGSVVAQSPVAGQTAPSPFSPAVTSAVTPGPARKKLSLSDYTSRRAKLAQQTANPSVTPPPLASQATSSPTMEKSSLPSAASPSNKSVDSVLPTVTEETTLGDPPTATTNVTQSTSTA
ncbi:hypothetical protein CC80DRAFT_295652 [Byssothecium circinans]|uniref:SET domain-containing protein n=1 Tax=Byssothecium circinans TaxID=147558 RepID=A0A6A5TIS5_9PLEO|nr:hypothetical protein CC80DRAFT_295652 [Byssothecium circinans]